MTAARPVLRRLEADEARDRVVAAYRDLWGTAPSLVVRAPGRVNLLGAHVDYSEGWVLPGAIDRAVWLAAGPGEEGRLRAHSVTYGQSLECSIAPAPGPAPEGRDRSSWIEYAAGVAWALQATGRETCGLNAVLISDLPVGAGVSSSAALEVAFLLAWRELVGFEMSGAAAADLGRVVENDYLDVQSGIMDQYASLHGRAGHVLLLDCRTVSHELLELPAGTAVLVADSGVRRRLVEGGLNDRRGECQAALAEIRRRHPEVAALRDVSPALAASAAGYLPASLHRRVRHVVEECARVRAGGDLLRSGADGVGLGELMRLSHVSSRDLYEVSVPELDLLAETAWRQPGCLGARLAGAGFGGCVTVLVMEDEADRVSEALREAFSARFGERAQIHRATIADGAEVAWRA
jgi:galactokinase